MIKQRKILCLKIMHHSGHAYQKLAFIENSEGLNIVMQMYNLLECYHDYSMTFGNLWNYYGDKINDIDVNVYASDGISSEHKRKILGETLKRSSQPGNSGDTNQPTHNHQYHPYYLK